MRTQKEIVARIGKSTQAIRFGEEVLVGALDFEHAKPFIRADVTEQEWSADAYRTDDDVRRKAVKYLKFAWGKASDHRGISASRSVEKMTEFLWLLGMDEAVRDMEDAGYAQYGAPKLRVAAVALGQPIPTWPGLVRMMDGLSCCDGCEEGCGR